MIQLPYRVPYGTKPATLIGAVLLCGLGIWLFVHEAFTNLRIFVIDGLPVAPDRMAIIFWVLAGFSALFGIFCLGALVRQWLTPGYFGLTESAIVFTRGKTRLEIPYRSITLLAQYRYRRRHPVTSLIVRASGRKYVISAHRLPGRGEFERIGQHLAAIVSSR